MNFLKAIARSGSPLAVSLLLMCALSAPTWADQPALADKNDIPPTLPLDFSRTVGDVVVNEYLAAGLALHLDEDGDASDWLELFNRGTVAHSLADWGLSDDAGEPMRWLLPDYTLLAGEHLLVYLSAKDRHLYARHYETAITRGDTWSYLTGSAPPSDWRDTDFDDSAWPAGPSGFGWGDGDDATELSPVSCVYLRHEFTVTNAADLLFMMLHVDFDDAYVAYLNGVEVARSNIGEAGVPPTHGQPADGTREARIYGGYPPWSDVLNSELVHDGLNCLAIQVHDALDEEDDLSCIPFLTLGYETAPPGALGADEYIAPILPRLHASFQLDVDGEVLILSDAEGGVRDVVVTGRLWNDISRGRLPDGQESWLYFATPSPGERNGDGGFEAFCEEPLFSQPGGLLGGPIQLALTSPLPGAEIRYTLNGAAPDEDSQLYSMPLEISQTTVVRARCFLGGLGASHTVTQSYFLGENLDLPLVSLSLDPADLWDDETGIYVLGSSYHHPEPPYWGANFWQEWEKAAHLEFYETDGGLAISQDLGVRIHGGATRWFAQKSLRLTARSGFGPSTINHPVFPDKPVDEFHRLILRNAGNDWLKAQFRDALTQDLGAGLGLERQACRPARVFINGQYWGLQNLRERVDCDYLASNHGCDAENLSLLEGPGVVREGDGAHYEALLDYIASHDLADDETFAAVESMMDCADFATYCILQIHCANIDWPGNNIRFWRDDAAQSRWRWILSDTDYGLGGYMDQHYEMLAHALDPDGEIWSNPPWSTFLLRSLMLNDGFRRDFINRYCELTSGPISRASMLQHLDLRRAAIESEIPRHFARWSADPTDWYSELALLEDFIDERPAIARGQLRDYFGLGDDLELSFAVEPAEGGVIRLQHGDVDSIWRGDFFEGHPLELRAVPREGYRFAAWSAPGLPPEEQVVWIPENSVQLVAQFLPDDPGVMIHEINYNSAPDFAAGDWVELYNLATIPVDISGWTFNDSANSFTFAEGTVVEAQGYVLLCQDRAAFEALFEIPGLLLFETGFGLDNDGEALSLRNSLGEIIDDLIYGESDPWPEEADGSGRTLELVNPAVDNAIGIAWAASFADQAPHGTPGKRNSVFCGCIDENGDPVRSILLGIPWPNPFTEVINLEFSLPLPGTIFLGIYDVNGRLVETLNDGPLIAGWQTFRWEPTELASGVYLVLLRSENELQTAKIVFLK